MPNYANGKISKLIKTFLAGNPASKGKALENAKAYSFEKVPGISITQRNVLNTAGSQEIDLVFWNDKNDKGFNFLPEIILVECKNWDVPVSASTVETFISKISSRGRDFGILIAANGITGDPTELTRAHFQIAMALSKKINLIVITVPELEKLKSTENLVHLIKVKLTNLVAKGTAI